MLALVAQSMVMLTLMEVVATAGFATATPQGEMQARRASAFEERAVVAVVAVLPTTVVLKGYEGEIAFQCHRTVDTASSRHSW